MLVVDECGDYSEAGVELAALVLWWKVLTHNFLRNPEIYPNDRRRGHTPTPRQI